MQLVLSRLAAGVALAMLASSSFAADAPAQQSRKPESAQSQDAMRVYRDPATGALSSQPAGEQQAADSTASESRFSDSSEGLTEKRHSSGMVSVDLQGRFESTMVAKVGADGTLTIGCGEAAHGSAPHSHGADGKAVPATPAREER